MAAMDIDIELLNMATTSPSGQADVNRTLALLGQQVVTGKFNKQGAIQIFSMCLERCLLEQFHSMGVPYRRSLFPTQLREEVARQLAEKFIADNGNIRDQRPTRTGLAAFIFGK